MPKNFGSLILEKPPECWLVMVSFDQHQITDKNKYGQRLEVSKKVIACILFFFLKSQMVI